MSNRGIGLLAGILALLELSCDRPAAEQRRDADIASSAPPIPTLLEAAAHFTFRGARLHPTCLDFSQEGSSRGNPVDLEQCNASTLTVSADARGWQSADHTPPARGYISYLVLAQKGERFLIATESWGGGTGVFSALMWVALDDAHVTNLKDVSGGDRCGGGLSSFSATQKDVFYSQNLTAADLISLSGEAVDSTATARLGWAYTDCFASAAYRVDLVQETTQLTGVELAVAPPAPGSAPDTVLKRDDPRSCLNALASKYTLEHGTSLTTSQLAEFVRQFRARCT
jgi:hypothetical protein